MTAVEWFAKELQVLHEASYDTEEAIKIVFEKAKQMEADQQYETKAFWFGRGILAGKEDRISQLKPTKN